MQHEKKVSLRYSCQRRKGDANHCRFQSRFPFRLLPEELLPAHWAGHTARQLCINIYQRVAPAALAFVSEKGETSVGELPAPGSLYFQRFGGLNIEQEALCQFIR